MGSQNQQPSLDTAVPSDSLAAAGKGITGLDTARISLMQVTVFLFLSVTKHHQVISGGVCEMFIPCLSQGLGQKRAVWYLQLVG